MELSLAIREAGLDPAECYRVRDLSFTKDDVRVYFNEGYLIFSRPVLGHRLTAVFSGDVEGGDGEVILIPPTRSERQSLANFAQSPNLDEHLRAALMVFTDGSAEQLRDRILKEGGGRPAPEMAPVLMAEWGPVVGNIMGPLQTRLIGDLLAPRPEDVGLAFLALSGKTLGTFDIISDARLGRRIVVRQRAGNAAGSGRPIPERGGDSGFNLWTSFYPRSVQRSPQVKKDPDFTLARYRIAAEIQADLGVIAQTRVAVRIGANPDRVFPFQIARAMQVSAVRIDGVPAELLRDEFARGRIAANGETEQFLVIAPAALAAGSEHEFEFEHQGKVITTRGDNVYFVSARGSWYPYTGSGFATYDLTFRYPRRLTLVSAGDLLEDRVEGETRITHRKTAVAIAAAGFNLGNYEKLATTAAGIAVEVYGNRAVEDSLRARVVFPGPSILIPPSNPARATFPPQPRVEPPPQIIMPPDPLGRLRLVSEDMSASLEFFSGLFGPPVLKTLMVAPIPGTFGQGFPGLVYLSTFAYIEPLERPAALRNARQQSFFSDLMVPHEAAHQWWGGVITVRRNEDEWLLEALANYSALLWVEKKKGTKELEKILNGYRGELLTKDEDNRVRESAGPIIWGDRLEASGVGDAWRVITYAKGTWVLHMLRRRLGDEVFLKMLGELRRRYEFRAVTTEDFRALVRELRPTTVPLEAIDTFFDNWVYSTGIPVLKVRYTTSGVAPAVKLTGALEQSGVDEDFSADIPVEVQFARGPAQTVWVRTSGDEKSFSATLRQVPARVVIPDDVLAKK